MCVLGMSVRHNQRAEGHTVANFRREHIVKIAGEDYAIQSFDAECWARDLSSVSVSTMNETHKMLSAQYMDGGYPMSGDEIALMKAGH